MVEVILKQDIYRLGDRGAVVKVAPGYARNYLFPQQLAIPADAGSLKHLEAMREAAARDAVRLRGDAEKQTEALSGEVIRVVARASLNNQLYGSVTTRDIAAKLAEKGVEIDRRRIQLTAPIRAVGDYDVPIHIYKDLTATVKVEVRAEGREEESLSVTQELAPEYSFAPATVTESESEATEGAEAAEGGEAAAETAPAAEGAAPVEIEAAAETDPAAETEAATETEASAEAETATEAAPAAESDAPEEAAAAGKDAAAAEAPEADSTEPTTEEATVDG